MRDEQVPLDHWRSIEANLYWFIVDNDLLPAPYRATLDKIYTAVAIGAKMQPRELPPPLVFSHEEAVAVMDARLVATLGKP